MDKKIVKEEEELTITAYTRGNGNTWTLWIIGSNIPNDVPGKENITAAQWYRVRLKNTGNLDKTSPGWSKTWTRDNTPVDITSFKNRFSIVKDNGHYTLTIKLRDDAVVENWYNEYDY